MSGGATASFVYDGDGNRVKGTVNGVTTAYVGNYYEYNVSTGVATSYYYAGSTRVAMKQGSTIYYLLSDHLGSTAVTANSTGGLYTEQRYYAFGGTRYNSPVTTPTTYRYTGQRQESALGGADGLYFYGARWYDPALGRFTQPDTIVPGAGNPQSLNRYSYTLNDPLKYVDPSGHAPGPWWVQRIMGGLAQYLNDVSCGALSVVANLDNVEGTDFQEGREAGRNASEFIATVETGLGIAVAATGLAAGPPTAALTAGAAVPSGGMALIPGTLALTAEGAMVLEGGAAALHGGFTLAYIKNNPIPPRIYRRGDPSPSNLKQRPDEDALSFRDSLSNPWPLEDGERPVFEPGDKYFGIDTSKLPPDSVIPDNTPPGHVGVTGVDVDTLKDAVKERGKFPQ